MHPKLTLNQTLLLPLPPAGPFYFKIGESAAQRWGRAVLWGGGCAGRWPATGDRARAALLCALLQCRLLVFVVALPASQPHQLSLAARALVEPPQLTSPPSPSNPGPGACRHGDRCSRLHNRPTISPTILLQNMYQNPVLNAPLGPDGLPIAVDPKKVQEFFEVGHCPLF